MTEAGARDAPRLPHWVGPLAIGAVLTVAVATGVQVWASRQRAHATDHWRGQLSAMAEDRRAAIESWVRERLGDARTIAAYPTTHRSVVGQFEKRGGLKGSEAGR